MSRSEDFDSEFWSDPDVADLSVTARYLYIWTWTNPRCNMSGAYRVSRALVTAETGIPDDDLDGAFAELEERRFAYYDGRVLWVRSRVKRLRQKTDNIAKSVAAHLEKLPVGHPYLALFFDEYADAGWLRNVESYVSLDGRQSVADTQGNVGSIEESATVGGVSPTLLGTGTGTGLGREGGPGETESAPAKLDEARSRLQAQQVQQVFDAWLAARTEHTGRKCSAVLDEKRKRLIRNALKTHPLDEVVDAVKGWRRSPYHRGENATRTTHDGLGLLLRNAEFIEKFRDLERSETITAPGQVTAANSHKWT